MGATKNEKECKRREDSQKSGSFVIVLLELARGRRGEDSCTLAAWEAFWCAQIFKGRELKMKAGTRPRMMREGRQPETDSESLSPLKHIPESKKVWNSERKHKKRQTGQLLGPEETQNNFPSVLFPSSPSWGLMLEKRRACWLRATKAPNRHLPSCLLKVESLRPHGKISQRSKRLTDDTRTTFRHLI